MSSQPGRKIPNIKTFYSSHSSLEYPLVQWLKPEVPIAKGKEGGQWIFFQILLSHSGGGGLIENGSMSPSEQSFFSRESDSRDSVVCYFISLSVRNTLSSIDFNPQTTLITNLIKQL